MCIHSKMCKMSSIWTAICISFGCIFVFGFMQYFSQNYINHNLTSLSLWGSSIHTNYTKLFNDVIIVGQFNYNTEWHIAKHWAKQWHKYANKIIIYTPNRNKSEQNPEWLTIRYYDFDIGYVSPYVNLVDAFTKLQNNSFNYKGIMYMHD
eukprot:455100_1